MELLERRELLAALGRELAAARAGSGGLVLLGGEAGAGKTALLRAFAAQQAAPVGVPVLVGACDPLATPRPLGPLHDVAPGLPAAVAQALVGGAPPYETCSVVLAALRDGPPRVVVLEDAHWADGATLDVVRFLGRRLSSAPALVVVTYRDDEVGPEHPLRLVLGDLVGAPAVSRLQVPLLTAAAVGALAARHHVDGAALHRLTGGNPFFASEVLSAAGRADALPETVRDAVLARAGRLGAQERALVDLVSLSPGRAERELLATVSGVSDGVLDACLSSGVLVPDGDGVRFRHELARRAVESAVPLARRRRLHEQLLGALTAAGADPARLAHHAQAAGDRDALLRHATAAGERAAAAGAHRQAAEQYARALAVAGALPARERAALLERRAFECYLTGQPGEALAAREEALLLWRGLGDRLREGDALRWLSRLAWYTGRGHDALAHAEQAVAVLEQLPASHELAMAWSNRAQLAMLAGDLPAAVHWGERAQLLAEELGDDEVAAHALNNTGTALAVAGRPEGVARLRRSLELARARDLEEHVARAFTNLVSVSVQQHDAAAADAALAEGLAYTTERDLDFWRWYLVGWQAQHALQQDRWEQAEQAATSVLAHALATPVSRVVALAALGRLHGRRDQEGAWALLDEARALARGTGELQRLAPVAVARAEVGWLQGRAPEPDLAVALELAHARTSPWLRDELISWAHRTGVPADPVGRGTPWAVALEGDPDQAVAAWTQRGCRYEAALAALDSADVQVLQACARDLQALGAAPLLRRVAARLRALGVTRVPRGPRSTTSADPHGLTQREREVLDLVADGLTSAAVAQRLVLSPRTVEHHVAAGMRKLGVTSRSDAVRLLRPAQG